MQIKFLKYQSAGNDFILIDCLKTELKISDEIIRTLCSRKTGIGADGVLVLKKHKDYDFEIIYYNPDGTQSLCCNGSRCAVKFFKKYYLNKSSYIILAFDGGHIVNIQNGNILFQMKIEEKIEKFIDGLFVNTGAPHFVHFTNNLNYNIKENALKLRSKLKFLSNVTFVDKNFNLNTIKATTFEKGVEEETLACGTGAVAAAIGSNIEFKMPSPIKVEMKGGNYTVTFNKVKNEKFMYTDIYIQGIETEVFRGEIDL